MTALKLTRETLIGLDRVLRVYLEGETGTDVVGPVPPLAVRVLDERSRRRRDNAAALGKQSEQLTKWKVRN